MSNPANPSGQKTPPYVLIAPAKTPPHPADAGSPPPRKPGGELETAINIVKNTTPPVPVLSLSMELARGEPVRRSWSAIVPAKAGRRRKLPANAGRRPEGPRCALIKKLLSLLARGGGPRVARWRGFFPVPQSFNTLLAELFKKFSSSFTGALHNTITT